MLASSGGSCCTSHVSRVEMVGVGIFMALRFLGVEEALGFLVIVMLPCVDDMITKNRSENR